MLTGLKEKLAAGEVSLGTWLGIGNAAVAEVLAASGFDWLVTDLEHGPFSIERCTDIFRACELHGCRPLARLSANDPVQAKRVLDAGCGAGQYQCHDDDDCRTVRRFHQVGNLSPKMYEPNG